MRPIRWGICAFLRAIAWRSCPATVALRLARYLGTSERFWLNLQARYDLEVEKDRLGRRLTREVRVLAAK
jgi:antitoxin HigA-1